MGVQLSYELVGAGWAKCTIRVDDATATVTASYLSDALDDLASAVSATLRGHPHATASFTEEPGEYRWVFEPLPEGKVVVRILEFREMWGGRPDEERAGIGFRLALPPARHDDLRNFRVLVIEMHPLVPTGSRCARRSGDCRSDSSGPASKSDTPVRCFQTWRTRPESTCGYYIRFGERLRRPETMMICAGQLKLSRRTTRASQPSARALWS